MKLVWTKSKLPLSVAIRWLLKEPVSHFAVVFDDRLVFHSNLFGTNLQWFDNFKDSCNIVYIKDFRLTLREEEEVYQNLIKFGNRSYDWSAFFKLLFWGLKKKLTGKDIPMFKDKSGNAHLCTDIAHALPERVVPFIVRGKTVTPYELYKLVK